MREARRLLGLPSDPTSHSANHQQQERKQARKAYLQLAKECHPDKCPHDPKAADRFKTLNAAYDVLCHGRPCRRDASRAHDCSSHDSDSSSATSAADAYDFAPHESELARQARLEREARFRAGALRFTAAAALLAALLWRQAENHPLVFPRPLHLSNEALARLPPAASFRNLTKLLIARRHAELGTLSRLAASLVVRPHTPYMWLSFARRDVRPLPQVLELHDRRAVLLVGRRPSPFPPILTYVHAPRGVAVEWPPRTTQLCVRLLGSGTISSRRWFDELQHAAGGRLRSFGLAVSGESECRRRVPSVIAASLPLGGAALAAWLSA